jgi:hypothetical protein
METKKKRTLRSAKISLLFLKYLVDSIASAPMGAPPSSSVIARPGQAPAVLDFFNFDTIFNTWRHLKLGSCRFSQ